MHDYRVGFRLLGAGLIVSFDARILQASSKVRLAALTDTNIERLELLTSEFRCEGYQCHGDMPQSPEIETVNMLMPHHFHYAAVIKTARLQLTTAWLRDCKQRRGTRSFPHRNVICTGTRAAKEAHNA